MEKNSIIPTIKMFLIVIGCLMFLVTVMGWMFPSHMIVSRVIDIQAPKDSIWMKVRQLKKWPDWLEGSNRANVSFIDDDHIRIENVTVTLKNRSAGSDTLYSVWETKNNGNLFCTFHVIEGNKKFGNFILQWQFEKKVGWLPWERFSTMMLDKIMGTMMERNLNKIKELSEN